MTDTQRTRHLIDRLSRLNAGAVWAHDLNPSQAAALGYLAQANRFSRSPSHVADYLASTRGTVSQTLKALVAKGLILETRSESDKRSIRYDLTPQGAQLADPAGDLDAAVAGLGASERSALNDGLSGLLHQMLRQRGLRSFGICKTCAHHDPRARGGYCRLLNVDLQPAETTQICHEHAA